MPARTIPLRLRWALARWIRRLARSAIAPTATLVSAVLLLVAAAGALHRLHDQHQRAEAARARRAATAPAQVPVADPVTAQLDAFRALLPPHHDAVQVLRELIERAEAQGLVLARGSYQSSPDAAGEFTRLRIVHPVSGDAQDVHRYLIDSLRTHRALALESVRFKRADGRSAQVEAQIQWVLFTRAAAADGGGS